ncbi:hypothetical protein KR51_00010980 [Rubidibacter lacunae KORDI 51-2]|uniref:Secreted protein n=1 Tax=Rubidibacter lacunae KORDI 51-2 TaxID=582515 RepID=U5DNJ0_9CHRO|nr:hypothetical protein [Rubidibacter lacunae]ERN42169.1 hypothetical protein KR51_00010980 [Rubidibacter lacunae KORDI 51-2]
MNLLCYSSALTIALASSLLWAPLALSQSQPASELSAPGDSSDLNDIEAGSSGGERDLLRMPPALDLDEEDAIDPANNGVDPQADDDLVGDDDSAAGGTVPVLSF